VKSADDLRFVSYSNNFIEDGVSFEVSDDIDYDSFVKTVRKRDNRAKKTLDAFELKFECQDITAVVLHDQIGDKNKENIDDYLLQLPEKRAGPSISHNCFIQVQVRMFVDYLTKYLLNRMLEHCVIQGRVSIKYLQMAHINIFILPG
jgi:hypothetical protein